MSEDERARIVKQVTLHRKFLHLSHVTVEHVTLAGQRRTIEREVHDHGNAATIFLYDPVRQMTVLVRQLRVAALVNGDEGWLLETPAGLLDGEHALEAICREAMEETSFRVADASHLFDAYMSPGALTERVSFFAAEVDLAVKEGQGGGLDHEGEDIEVVEISVQQAISMIYTGEIRDAKTIMLLQWARHHYRLD